MNGFVGFAERGAWRWKGGIDQRCRGPLPSAYMCNSPNYPPGSTSLTHHPQTQTSSPLNDKLRTLGSLCQSLLSCKIIQPAPPKIVNILYALLSRFRPVPGGAGSFIIPPPFVYPHMVVENKSSFLQVDTESPLLCCAALKYLGRLHGRSRANKTTHSSKAVGAARFTAAPTNPAFTFPFYLSRFKDCNQSYINWHHDNYFPNVEKARCYPCYRSSRVLPRSGKPSCTCSLDAYPGKWGQSPANKRYISAPTATLSPSWSSQFGLFKINLPCVWSEWLDRHFPALV